MIAVVLPVLARPRRVGPLLRSLRESEREVPLRPVYVCSPRDRDQIRAVRRAGLEPLIVQGPHPGDYARKVNAAYRASDEPWVFTGADDLSFHAGWADAALACAEASGARVIGTNDLGNPRVTRGSHSTHSLVARSYADELGTIDGPGAVLAEAYVHNFVDDELVRTACSRGEFHWCGEAVVEHLHPHWRKGALDATYRRGLSKFAADRQLYRRRAKHW